jgi:hypothetical protein
MPVRVIARDNFPLLAVASWSSRAEAHETITEACRKEALKSATSRLMSVLGAAANCNEPQSAPLTRPVSRDLIAEFSGRRR